MDIIFRCIINDYFVYSLYKKKAIVKYNLFNRKKSMVFQCDDYISQYHISKDNLIVCTVSKQVYWNGIITHTWESGYLKYVKIKYGEYLVSFINNRIINRKKETIYRNVPYFCVSPDGQKILFEYDNNLYVQNASCVSLDKLFKKKYAKLIRPCYVICLDYGL